MRKWIMIMKKHIKYITAVLVAVLVSGSCTKFDDMNDNPYALTEASSAAFVQSTTCDVLKRLASTTYSWVGDLMQYSLKTSFETSSQLVYNYVISEENSSSMWNLYEQFGNTQYMLERARKECAVEGEGNPAMIGVALIMHSVIAQLLTDTYGNVPYSQAGLLALQDDNWEYTPKYDNQKDIYIDLLRSMEEANACFNKAKEMKSAGTLSNINFNSRYDYMYNGDVDKWQRFGNSLYLRILMRVSNKVVEESDGIISLGEEFGDINVLNKINELYDCHLSGSGDYPMMRNLNDSARMQFSSKNSALYSPFYFTTGALWKQTAACSTIVSLMLVKTDDPNKPWDPRYYRYFTKGVGAPTQETSEVLRDYFDSHISSAGNSTIGRYPLGAWTGSHIGDLKMDCAYTLLNYDEQLFLFAEAGARQWIPMSQKNYKDIYLDANLQNILQWQVGWEHVSDYYTASSPEVINFINYLDNEFDYNRAIETILRQKYVASFWVGIESWADYRRTGYPVLRTNGPAAQNNGILPTRMRYPSTEAYQNTECYKEAINSWLGGENNLITDVWWADTQESKAIRRLGRQ